MNRIQMQSGAQPRPKLATPALQPECSLVFENSAADNHYCIFAPLHYEPNYAYPLLVWLHGQRDDERQLQRIMPLVSMRNYVAVGPRAVDQVPNAPGFDWGTNEDATQIAQQRILAAIDAARIRYNIASERIYLAGLHRGGTMALRIALRSPEQFAGVASLGGAFPEGGRPLCDLRRLRKLPLFLAHSRDSRHYTLEKSCEDLRLLHSAGMAMTLRQYPCGDELTTKMLSDLNSWLMELVTGQKQPCEEQSWIEEEWN